MNRTATQHTLDASSKAALERYRRAVNYLTAAQIYLMDNSLLEEPLKPEHIKPRLLGHWGTAPGINLVCAHLNRLILNTDASIMLITGPGHGAAANLANMYLEGTLTEFFPHITQDKAGLKEFVKSFSWPDRFPSHLSPIYPGVIHEGGELGYALATAFGATLDNPDLIVACIVGDGEAETGPTAGAWHSNKFLNPATDGAVLPILHLNGFKIANPSIFGTMTDEELCALFTGYGYAVRIVDLSDHIDDDMGAAVSWAHEEIRALQQRTRSGEIIARPRWPMLILRTPKGWTGPKEVDGKKNEDSFLSHQVPAKEAKTNPVHLKIVETWLRSYRPQELFDKNGHPAEDIRTLCPTGDKRMAMNPHGFGGARRKPLTLPPLESHEVEVTSRGLSLVSSVERLGQYLRDVIKLNQTQRNFRIVCPDELESNKLGAVLEVTDRQYVWPLPEVAEHTARDGRVLEVLSEHNCQGWLQGYLLTGRHGLFPCYEAFLSIVDGMMNQYAKFLKSSIETPWRKPISSLNYLLTSEAWRQEHNGYSHQGPGFINNLLTKKGHTYRIYFPPDANCLLHTMDECLRVTNYINLVIAGKQPMPQWLTLDEAREHCRIGASVWPWASTSEGEDPQLVLACCGDNLTLETLAAADLLRRAAPDWRVRVVNVTDLLVLGIPQKYPHGLEEERFQRIFPLDCPVIFNFHGYTAAIKQLCWERPNSERFDINGYREEGTTTTPFDMHIRNRTSRYHLVIQAARKMAACHPHFSMQAEALIVEYERKLADHRTFILREGLDPPEINDWRWQAFRQGS
ncbi:MAG TPA: phosphoketolase family protein [Gammaproteobacteria bacterium]|nr:phosphoketolase family protein [Gammaproteobacteria bacterium]